MNRETQQIIQNANKDELVIALQSLLDDADELRFQHNNWRKFDGWDSIEEPASFTRAKHLLNQQARLHGSSA